METYIGPFSHPRQISALDEAHPAHYMSASLLDSTGDPSNLDSWYYNHDSYMTVSQTSQDIVSLCHETHLDQAPPGDRKIQGQDFYPSPPQSGSDLKHSLPLPTLRSGAYMDDTTHTRHVADGSQSGLFPKSHDVFRRHQPPSPPLETPELVHRLLPTSSELLSSLPLSPPPTISTNNLELPLPNDALAGHHLCVAEPLRPCFRGREEEHSPISQPLKRHCRWEDSEKGGATEGGKSLRHEAVQLLTPETPTSFWATPSADTSSMFPLHNSDDIIDDEDEMTVSSQWEDDLMDWTGSNGNTSTSTSSVAPSSPKPRTMSLELPKLTGFCSGSGESDYGRPPRSFTSPASFLSSSSNKRSSSLWSTSQAMDVDNSSSTASLPLELSTGGFDSELGFSVPVASPENDFSLFGDASSHGRDSGSLSDLGDFMTPLPSSPRPSLSPLFSDSLMDEHDLMEPSSPHSPHLDLPLLPGDQDQSPLPETISPALLSNPTSESPEGLGLFIQPSGIDPPLARSPSPDDDYFGFLDVQMDPLASGTEIDLDEFLGLRDLRKRALEAEREARNREMVLVETLALAQSQLHPSQLVHVTPEEKRQRKHALHVAMDTRAEARKQRKREKQRTKEVGTLLDIKLDRVVADGRTMILSMDQLVANMMFKRRDMFRPLANRRSASASHVYTPSRLSLSVTWDELPEDVDQERTFSEAFENE